MVQGQGSLSKPLSNNEVEQVIQQASETVAATSQRVLVIIPDGTRTSPLPLLFHLLYKHLGQRIQRLDYLVALGTHQPLSAEALSHLLGVEVKEDGQVEHYPHVRVFNHDWSNPQALQTIGRITREEARELTGGLLEEDVPVTLNRSIFAYDHLLICGPVFPHEVAGFSGGAKYLFPGIAGAEIIHFTHWLGALSTSMQTIGVKETPVRRIIEHAATFVPRPLSVLALVLKGQDMHGLYYGPPTETWQQAADLSGAYLIITWDTYLHR